MNYLRVYKVAIDCPCQITICKDHHNLVRLSTSWFIWNLWPLQWSWFHLALPHMHSHQMFHVFTFGTSESCCSSTTSHWVWKYTMENNLESKAMHNQLYYLVDWLNYTPIYWTWEHVQSLANATKLVAKFIIEEEYSKHPNFILGNKYSP